MSYSTVPSDLAFPLPATINLNYNNGSIFSTAGTFTLRNGATTLSTFDVKIADSYYSYYIGQGTGDIMYPMGVDNNNKIYLFYRIYSYNSGQGTYTHYNSFSVYNATTYSFIYSVQLPYAFTKSPAVNRQDAYGNSYFSSYSNTIYIPYLNTTNNASTLVCVSTIDYSTTTIAMPSGGNSVTGDNNGNLYFTSNASKDITRYNIGTATSTTFFSNPTLISGAISLISCFIANDGFFYALSEGGNIYKISSDGTTGTLFINSGATWVQSMCYNSLNGNIYRFSVNAGVGIVSEVTPSATSTVYRSALDLHSANVNISLPTLSNFYNVYDNSIYWGVYNGFIGNTSNYVFASTITFSTNTLYFVNVYTTLFTNGTNTLQIYRNGVAFGSPIVITIPCFLEGTKILRMNQETDDEEYVPVETLRRGDLIKTIHGYKAIELIGSKEIHPLAIEKKSSQLYWFRKSKIAGLTEDLCVTGDHCILHKSISSEKKDQVLEYMGDIYITEGHYRVPAFLDDRSEPYKDSSTATIWHFALENPNIYHNYGVMANGILVESSSLHYMYKYSNMRLI